MGLLNIEAPATLPQKRRPFIVERLWRRPGFVIGFILFVVPLFAVVIGSILLPPGGMDSSIRLTPPSWDHPFGADNVGRDLFGQVLRGGRISLLIGISVAALSTLIGLAIGLLAGFFRLADGAIMRVMDGLMAIPGILLAIALMSIAGAGVVNVIIAITISEVPRVVRLVRSMVLSLRDQIFVDAARVAGCRTQRIIFRHILPMTLGPLAVQATFICTSAIITEAYLSFIGAGTPPDLPSWGNIIAEGRIYFRNAPWIVLIPGGLIATTVLGINLMGDALRDVLDHRATQTP
jgi:peptide/nickel transport system permease protein